MKMYSPGNCLCSVGHYWNTGKAFQNPGESGNLNETIFGFCTGVNTPFVLTPSQSSPLGVDVESKKVLYRRGSGQEIWTRNLIGTTALLYAAGDIYDNSLFIRDIIYNESTGFSSVRLLGLAPYTGGSVASFNNASGNFVNGPHPGGAHATDSSGNIYTFFFTNSFGLGSSLIEIKMYKNGVEYATLNNDTTLTHSYTSSLFATAGGTPYVCRVAYPAPFINYRLTRIVSGGNPGDHESVLAINNIGTPLEDTSIQHKSLARTYYNFNTQVIDAITTVSNNTVPFDAFPTISRFNLDLSRNATIVTNWNPGNELDSFVFKDG